MTCQSRSRLMPEGGAVGLVGGANHIKKMGKGKPLGGCNMEKIS